MLDEGESKKHPDILADLDNWRHQEKDPSLTNFKKPDAPWDASQIVGEGEVYDRVRQMVEDLYLWKEMKLSWDEISPSIIVEGEPGTGKTYLAHQISNVIGLEKTIVTSYSDWQAAGNASLGPCLKAMSESFKEARAKAPSLLFIDEIDTLGTRGSAGDPKSENYWRAVVNGFLAELNVSEMHGVLVIGACNDASGLDPAILRDGRFDETLQMELPGPESIAKMIENRVKDVDSEQLAATARILTGETPAAIDGAIRKLKSECRRKKESFSLKCLEEKLLPDTSRRDTIWKRVSLHECGHAIASKALGLGSVERVMMHSSGSGFALSRTHIAEGVVKDLESRLIMLMAGRAAEKLIMESVSAGAGGSEKSDIAKATRIALEIEYKYGMGEGGAAYAELRDGDWIDTKTSDVVKRRIRHAQEKAVALLRNNRVLLLSMAEDLVKLRSMKGDVLAGWLDQAVAFDPDTDVVVHDLHASEMLRMLASSPYRFMFVEQSGSQGATTALLAANSRHDFLLPLMRIGYFYGDYHQRKVKTNWVSVCMEGFLLVTNGLPKSAVIKSHRVKSFSRFLLEKKEMSAFKMYEQSSVFQSSLHEIEERAKDPLTLEA